MFSSDGSGAPECASTPPRRRVQRLANRAGWILLLTLLGGAAIVSYAWRQDLATMYTLRTLRMQDEDGQTYEVLFLEDGWTAVDRADRSLLAHADQPADTLPVFIEPTAATEAPAQ